MLDLDRGERGRRFRDASIEDGVYEPSRRTARRVLRRLRSALARRK
jgi:hypothetical protein